MMQHQKKILAIYLGVMALIGLILQSLSHFQTATFCELYIGVEDAEVATCTQLYDTSALYKGVATKHIFFFYIALLPFAAYHNWGTRENRPLLQLGALAAAFILVGNIVMLMFAQQAGEMGSIPIREWFLSALSIAALVFSFLPATHEHRKPSIEATSEG